MGIKLPVISLHHVHVNTINFPTKKLPPAFKGDKKTKSNDKLKLSKAKSGQVSPFDEEEEDEIYPLKAKERKVAKLSISLYFRERTFRLYPFSPDEVRIVTDRIAHVSGVAPTATSVLVRSLLVSVPCPISFHSGPVRILK